MNSSIAALASAGVVLASATSAMACAEAVDMPALARRGPAPIGVMTISVVDPARPDLAAGRRPAVAHRTLSVTLWYPARASAQPPAPYVVTLRHPGRADSILTLPGCAVPDAEPAARRAPLVVISHGYGGWATYLSDLAETLASRGYVVASIDHNDLSFNDAAGFALSFGSTAVHRSADQRAVIARLRMLASSQDFRLANTYDPDRLAVIGYSMGGFGALATAGAGYNQEGGFYRQIPADLLGPGAEGQVTPVQGLRALVLIAPWGGQSDKQGWSAAALSSVTTPTLMVVGDHDDVSGYEDGVLGIFEGLKGSDRYLLTYQNARHNVIGADVPEALRSSFDIVERFEEPVWRKDRLRSITRHYVLAFLDKTFGEGGGGYLKPVTAGEVPKGFERRWALGFTLRHEAPAR